MSEVIINSRTEPHYKEFKQIARNFNWLEKRICLKSMSTEMLEMELERRHQGCVEMIQSVYAVLDNAEKENKLTALADLEMVCKELRNITKGQPITATQQANNPNERIDLILSQGEQGVNE